MKRERYAVYLVLLFSLIALGACSCGEPQDAGDSSADTLPPTGITAPAETAPHLPATPIMSDTPTAPAGAALTATPTETVSEDAPRIASDVATLESPAAIGTAVIFPGGLEVTIIDVIFPATAFLADEVGGDDLQRRVVDEATAGRAPLVVEWMATCPITTTALPLTTVCGALLSANAAGQPLVDLAAYTAYDPRFPQVLGLPYGVPAGETRRSFIISTSIPADETPALLEVVYYLSDVGKLEYAAATFDLRRTP